MEGRGAVAAPSAGMQRRCACGERYPPDRGRTLGIVFGSLGLAVGFWSARRDRQCPVTFPVEEGQVDEDYSSRPCMAAGYTCFRHEAAISPGDNLAMSKLIPAAASLLAAALLLSQTPPGSEPFLEKPYLQLGDAPKISPSESLVLMWHTDTTPAQWAVEVRTSRDSAWRAVGQPTSQTVSAPAGEPAAAGDGAGGGGKKGTKKGPAALPPIKAYFVFPGPLAGARSRPGVSLPSTK